MEKKTVKQMMEEQRERSRVLREREAARRQKEKDLKKATQEADRQEWRARLAAQAGCTHEWRADLRFDGVPDHFWCPKCEAMGRRYPNTTSPISPYAQQRQTLQLFQRCHANYLANAATMAVRAAGERPRFPPNRERETTPDLTEEFRRGRN